MNDILFISLKNGDVSAMDKIFDMYWEAVFDTAFRKTGDEALAQDITQEIFISLWEHRKDITLTTTLSAYLHGSVRYKVINHFRSAVLTAEHRKQLSLLMNQQHAVWADEKVILQDINQALDAALACLPEGMREVICMSRKQGKSIKEIASELDISVQTVKNQITAALKLLRKNLSYMLLFAFFLS